MAGLDSRFVVTSDLEEYFVDKDSGFPLAAGIVTFYSDINRTTKKPVYQLTGSPPNYSYSALPNPCILSGVGTFQDDDGNNIVPYYFPYEGTPDDSDGTIELYYITVENSGEVPQFTREGWPNFTSGDTPSSNEGFRNFIPNGQFLNHTDIVGTTQPPVQSVGGIDIQYIAQGGWSFKRTTGGASIFNNSFTRLTGGVAGLDDFPRYAFNFVCSSFNASDQIRDLSIEWPGINQFSSGDPPGSQPYTLFLAAESNDASTYTFDVRLIRNYGTTGTPSPQSDTSIGTVLIGPSYTTFNVNIPNIPVAAGTLGDNNDDFVAVTLRGPASSFNVQVTDFAFMTGTVQPDFFPVQTDADMKARGIAGWMPIPNPDGSDLYLAPVLTPKGMVFDRSPVGKIYACGYTSGFTGSLATDANEIICDGTAYVRTDYSPLGIPYQRLFDKLFDSATFGLPIFGTGINFATPFVLADIANELLIATNKAGAQTNTADGAATTGFTFTTPITGNTAYGLYSYISTPQNLITSIGTVAGTVTPASAGTSGFTVTQVDNASLVKQVFTVLISSLPGAGTYFTFDIVGGGPFYVWFTIDGVGADPAPGGTGILVPLLSSYSTTETSVYIKTALLGAQLSRILTVAASALTAGDYFTFHANGATYIVWYEIAGLGAAPAIGGTPIKVALAGTETNAQVADETGAVLATYQFAVPNLKGVTLRGMNVGANNIPGDPGFNSRFTLEGLFNSPYGVGSYQASTLLQHAHAYTEADAAINGSGVGADPYVPGVAVSSTGTAGGAESVPFNMYVNYVIKY